MRAHNIQSALPHCLPGSQRVVFGARAATESWPTQALIGVRLEAERGGVDAVALSGRRGTVVEDVSLVRPARGAVHLSPAHEEAALFLSGDVRSLDGRPEAGPTRAGVVLRLGAEEGRPAAHAAINSLSFVVPVLPRECALGALLTRYSMLLGRQLAPPLLVGEIYLLRRIGHGVILACAGIFLLHRAPRWSAYLPWRSDALPDQVCTALRAPKQHRSRAQGHQIAPNLHQTLLLDTNPVGKQAELHVVDDSLPT